MKHRTTKKAMYENYGKDRIVCLGYCSIQGIENYLRPTAYTCGVYGWNADIYEPQGYNYAICTGYRPFGTSDPELYELCDKWEKKVGAAEYKERPGLVQKFLKELNDKLIEVTK